MIRTILSIAILAALATASVQAEATPRKRSSTQKKKETSTPKIVPATPLVSGWSYVNGVWTHVDGYKLVKGQVVRSGIQTHKKAPPPPTKAEMDAVMKKTKAPKTPAEIAAEKEAQRQRNLAPTAPKQTGSHL
jgi:hypothetical protein